MMHRSRLALVRFVDKVHRKREHLVRGRVLPTVPFRAQVTAMLHAYPAIYQDKHGVVRTTLFNDGRELWMMLRGIEFRSSQFDDFEPPADCAADKLTTFSLDKYRQVIDYELECDIPIPVATVAGEMQGVLHSRTVHSSNPEPRFPYGTLIWILTLRYGNRELVSSGKSRGWFLDEFLEIQRQMPEGEYVKCCLNCVHCDSHPGGPALFGQWSCFRDNETGFLAARTKQERMAIWSTKTEDVQEIHLCPQFKRTRKP